MIEIRSCCGFEELEACVQLQIETWGYDENDVIPRKTFLLAQKIGGQVIGAFDSAIGRRIRDQEHRLRARWFRHVFAGDQARPEMDRSPIFIRTCWQSANLTAIVALARNSNGNNGVKRFLAVFSHMEWTFDPLQIPNAFLNIHRLGAISSAYRVDFYGVSSSRLQGGLPTDRLLAEWELDSPRVEAILAQRPAAVQDIQDRILVPAPIDRWKASEGSRQQALAVQLENRQKFQAAFSRGLVVLGFSRDAEGNGIFELGSPHPDAIELWFWFF